MERPMKDFRSEGSLSGANWSLMTSVRPKQNASTRKGEFHPLSAARVRNSAAKSNSPFSLT